jgi:hypothetical protein
MDVGRMIGVCHFKGFNIKDVLIMHTKKPFISIPLIDSVDDFGPLQSYSTFLFKRKPVRSKYI